MALISRQPNESTSRGESAIRGRGFTLLELLVVIVIIGLLAAYVGPRYFSQLGRSERTVAKAQLESLAKALDAFRATLNKPSNLAIQYR